MSEPRHFSIVILDVEGSGQLSGPEKEQIRKDLYALRDRALEVSGIDAAAVRSEDRGDGIYLLVPGDISKRLLIDPFLGAVDAQLAERRMGQPGLRLRLVVHHGEVSLDEHGSSGGAVDTAFAMVDSPQLRAALRDSGRGRMAVVVPDELYQSFVRGYPEPDPTRFRMRHLETKRGRLRTWVTVIGAAEQPGSGATTVEAPAPVATGPQPSMHIGDQNNIDKNDGFVGRSYAPVYFGVPPQATTGGDR